MKGQISLLGIFNADLLEAINDEYLEQDRELEEVELVRDGAIYQINKAWHDIIESLTLAPDGIGALETLFRDNKDILKRFVLMQRLTEIIDDIEGLSPNEINNAENESAEKE